MERNLQLLADRLDQLVQQSVFNSDRAPTPLDDSSQGFRVGSLWLRPNIGSTAMLYFCLDATIGQARWRGTSLTLAP